MSKQLAKANNNSIPSPPQRLVDLASMVGTVQHEGQPVRYNLPTGVALSNLDRQEAASLLSTLTSALDRTASFGRTDGHSAKAMLLTKMIRGLGGALPSEAAATAKIEMYADAVEDLPAWAIDTAIKRWGRGSCPAEIEERPNFNFPPSPAALRKLALDAMDIPKRHARLLTNLLAAMPVERAMDPEPIESTAMVPKLRRM